MLTILRAAARVSWPIAVILASAGCAHYPVNAPLARYEPAQGYRFPLEASRPNTRSLFICLAFSGGGTRAAALAYGVLEKLREVRMTWEGVDKRLLDEVDCSRSDLAATLYDETLFDGKTFADFSPTAPFVILNATNIASGERFEFTQDQFDFLGSRLADYPVARAVAASSAFPVLLSPISLFNHRFGADYAPPAELQSALDARDTNPRRFRWGRHQVAYLDKERHPYIHLVDGGIADNIGLRSIENAQIRSSGFVRQLLNRYEVKRQVLIIVNARTEPEEKISRREGPPGSLTVMYQSATIPMDNYSFETIEGSRENRERDAEVFRSLENCRRFVETQCPFTVMPSAFPRIPSHIIEVNFEAIEDPERRKAFLNLPTSFALGPAEVQEIIDVAKELLDRSPDFRELLQALGSR